jgi:hypothetical protein
LTFGLSRQFVRAETSALWGQEGEAWKPEGRLPDFSLAGYWQGNAAPPALPPGRSVRDFGAVGDGEADDTAAFARALQETSSGAVEIPPGRYRVTRPLVIDRPGVVLRGAGPDRVTLFCPIPLNTIAPNWGATTTGRRTSNYSWSGGFLRIQGRQAGTVLSRVAAAAERGTNSVLLRDASRVAVGDWIEITQQDTPDNSLARHLYSDDPGPVDELRGRTRTSQPAQVVSIVGSRLRLNRPLRTDLRLDWRPEVRAFAPSVTESGLEGLTLEFPQTPYRGHFTEEGFNGIALSGVAHCWVRDVRMVNPDSGLFLQGWFNTGVGVAVDSQRPPDRQGCTGHHGLSVGGADNWVTRFDLRTHFIHDITLTAQASGNVFSKGRGQDLSLDHHRRAPYENLFTDLDAGVGSRLWMSGGGAALGKHCGARGTFWGIASQRPLPPPPSGFGPVSLNVVGLASDAPARMSPAGPWFEPIPPVRLHPRDLHLAQRSRRLASAP